MAAPPFFWAGCLSDRHLGVAPIHRIIWSCRTAGPVRILLRMWSSAAGRKPAEFRQAGR